MAPMTNKNIIAIDGPAASGKGTLARKIADHLGYAHMDTGLLYRSVAFDVLEAGGKASDEAAAVTAAENFAKKITASSSPPSSSLILHIEKLKEERVTEAASFVASFQAVRRILLNLQHSFIKNPGTAYKGAVLDGRDIGTVICPAAPVKLFVTAAIETRAERRFKELQNKGDPVTYEAVLRDMQERDARDAARLTSPMKPADDAVILDTTDLGPDEALEKALKIVRDKLPR
jgi:cytidylate kinase